MASSVSFNQDLLTSWVQLCDTLGTAQRSGENPNLVEDLRAQVAVSLVSLIQSSSSPISEEASQGLLSMLLEPADSSTSAIQDTMLENLLLTFITVKPSLIFSDFASEKTEFCLLC